MRIEYDSPQALDLNAHPRLHTRDLSSLQLYVRCYLAPRPPPICWISEKCRIVDELQDLCVLIG